MEILGIVSVPTWLLVILTLVLSIYLYGKKKHSYFKDLGIPSMPCTFMLGDLPIVSKKGFGYLDADCVKEYGKVFGIYLGNIPSLVVCDTKLIKEIMVKQFNNFTDRNSVIPSHERWMSALNVAEGSHWKFLRSTLSPTFSSGKMRNITHIIQHCLNNFHEIMEDKVRNNPDGFDIAPLVQGLTMDVICNAGFGIEVNAQKNPENEFVMHARKFLQVQPLRMPTFLLNVLFPDLRFILRHFPTNFIPSETFEFMKSATMSAFEDRKKTGSSHKDLLQLMINAHKGEVDSHDSEYYTYEEFKSRGLTDEEVLVNSIVFMSAGYDTTSAVLSWYAYDLVINPEVQEKLIQEIDAEIGDTAPAYDNVFKLRYLDMVTNETLRMHPPATRFNRRALEDVNINGVHIKKGLGITFAPMTVHYMPEYWENPNQYNPERFAPENQAKLDPYAFMPFGQGPRHCVAMRLAELEMKMTIVSILQKYRLVKADKLEVPMTASKMGIRKPATPVLIKAEHRK